MPEHPIAAVHLASKKDDEVVDERCWYAAVGFGASYDCIAACFDDEFGYFVAVETSPRHLVELVVCDVALCM